MCGLVGVYAKNTPEAWGEIEALVAEAQIRGKHSTGVSLLIGNHFSGWIDAIPSRKFLHKNLSVIKAMCKDEEYLYQIWHTRYCTSGPEHNQPIIGNEKSVAVNGVISQAPPEEWIRIYPPRDPYQTTNDAEILHRIREDDRDPFTSLNEEASFAAIELTTGMYPKQVIGYRNGKRPLYYVKTAQGEYFVSTQQMVQRALKGARPKPIPLYQMFVVGQPPIGTIDFSPAPQDLQNLEFRYA